MILRLNSYYADFNRECCEFEFNQLRSRNYWKIVWNNLFKIGLTDNNSSLREIVMQLKEKCNLYIYIIWKLKGEGKQVESWRKLKFTIISSWTLVSIICCKNAGLIFSIQLVILNANIIEIWWFTKVKPQGQMLSEDIFCCTYINEWAYIHTYEYVHIYLLLLDVWYI